MSILKLMSCHDTELHFCKIITGIYVGEGMVINFTTGAIQEKTTTRGLLFTSSALSSFDTNIPCPRCGDSNQTKNLNTYI
jgi:hypothetical protein